MIATAAVDLRPLVDRLEALAARRLASVPRSEAALARARRLSDHVRGHVRVRAASLDAPLVVVLLGPTGAGKSTLFNTIAGRAASQTGVLRPTTRAAVVLLHPSDREALEAGALVGIDPALLRLVEDASIEPGLALVDAPDIDSIEHANRDLADRLAEAADLCLFVTTATRYADRVPWDVLARVRERRLPMLVIVNRMPPDASDRADVVRDLRRLLVEHDLGPVLERSNGEDAIVSVPEGSLAPGGDALTPDAVPAVLAEVARLRSAREERRALAARALAGSLAGLGDALDAIADDAQHEAIDVEALRRTADRTYESHLVALRQELDQGAFLREEALRHWQAFVGADQITRFFSEGIGRVRGAISALLRPATAPVAELRTATTDDLMAVARLEAAEAARRVASAWSADPAMGQAVSAAADLWLPSPDFDERLRGRLQAWMDGIAEDIQAHGRPKRTVARGASLGVNAVGTGVMLATFLHTGGLTGAEVGVAAATAFLNQKLLSALFGEAAMVELVSGAVRRAARALGRARLAVGGPPRRGTGRARAARGSMTVVAGPAATSPAGLDAADPLARCLATGGELADAAAGLGLDTARLRTVVADARRRLGFPGDAYVLALVGGTGVGKSTLLNVLAGGEVSRASVLRPTTAEPVAWVPASQREALGPLLDWLGVTVVREHAADEAGPVAILDLPDMDSLAAAHRERVEAILPRVDAVAWVTDPEKYHDAVLHDDFLHAWLPRLARQAFVLNKADRLAPDEARQIARELETDAESAAATARVPVLLAAARDARVEDVRGWISAGVEAKSIIRAQAAAGLVASARALLRDGGLAADRAPAPLLDDDRRARAIRETTAALLRAIDVDGLEAQAVAATRASARRTGAGPVGFVTSLVYRGSGRETRVADPRGYLLRWRDRGSTAPAVEVVRSALAEPLRAVPPALRPVVAEAMDPAVLRQGLERAVDRAVNGVGPIQPPRSAWWRLLGMLQVLATAGIALSAAWVVVWILVRPATGSVDLPIIGPVPTPFASLVAFVIAGFVLARVLGAHAGWVGRRWAGGVRDRIASAIAHELESEALRPLDELDARRATTWSLAAAIVEGCGA